MEFRCQNRKNSGLRRKLFLFIVVGFSFLTIESNAACTSPAGVAGSRQWFSADNVYRLCNGTTWEGIVTGTSIGNCSRSGDIEYNSSQKAYGVCDSTNYKQMSCRAASTVTVTPKGTASTSANLVGWTPLTNVTLAQGETLFVCVTSKNDGPSSITWNGQALTLDSAAIYPGVFYRNNLWRISNVTAGTGNISMTLSGSNNVKSMLATAVKGLAATSVVDQQVNAYGFAGTETVTSGNTAPTSQPNEFLFACMGGSATGIVWTSPATAGQNISGMWGAYQTVSAVGNYNATASTTGGYWMANLVTYKLESCQNFGACPLSGALDYEAGNGLRWCDGSYWRQIYSVQAPTNLSYPNPQVFTVESNQTSFSPTVTNFVSNYSISPPLPSGLSINSATGVISGTPAAASSAATYTVTATNAAGSVNYSFTLSVDYATGTIAGSDYTLADFMDYSTITITLYTAQGNPLVGVAPTYFVTGSGNTAQACTVTNASGISTCKLYSTVAQTKTIAVATPSTLGISNTVTFYPPPVAVNSSIVAAGTAPADYFAPVVLTITLKDASGVPVVGKIPTVTGPGTVSIIQPTVPTNSSGQTTVSVMSGFGGNKTISLATPITGVSGTATFTASALSIVNSGPIAQQVSECRSFTIYSLDGAGNYVDVLSNTLLDLARDYGGSFYSDSGCGSPITSVTLLANSHQVSVWFKDTVAEDQLLWVSDNTGIMSVGVVAVKTVVTCRIFVTSGTTWTTPSDWNDNDYKIEVIGGGGGGATSSGANGAGGGGGGGYSSDTSSSGWTIGRNMPITVKIGSGGAANANGGDTYFCGSTSGCASIAGTSVIAGAKGGVKGTTAGGGAGGLAGSGVGAITLSGGTGATFTTSIGGGGGGAAGLNAAGNDSSGQTGGRGDGTFGGTAGAAGTEWDATHGSGGGGNGGINGAVGSAAGLYGAGGGGGGGGTKAGGAGKAGLIVITYTGQTCN